ncbi:TetR/AcrR family transcriptional regulator [Actinoplanes sp. NPDC051851]|uniref:TetR/AcrR family transcriptional regulator n=1 Tax=Actinoplanes sp. NPDC051851 TaxID=3154753 RepID=UPI00342FEB08
MRAFSTTGPATRRGTFFRLFGDKQEVVFARQQELLDTIAAAARHNGAAATSLADAVEQLRPVVLELLTVAVSDPQGYTRHFRLVEQHPELIDRDAVKTQQIARKLGELLVHRGSDEATAMLAGQVAIACYLAAKSPDDDPGTLIERASASFARVLTLGIG